jgi:hypothetical protein
MKSTARAVRSIVEAFLVGCLAACGNLNVSVDVLNPDHVRQEVSEGQLRDLYREIAAGKPDDVANSVDRGFRPFKQKVGEYTNAMRVLAAKLPERKVAIERSAEALDQGVATGGDYALRASSNAQLMERLAQDIRVEGANVSFNGVGAIPQPLRDKLVDFTKQSKALATEEILTLRATQRAIDSLAREAAKERGAKVAEAKSATVPVATSASAVQQQESVAASIEAATLAAVAPQVNSVKQAAQSAQAAATPTFITGTSIATTQYAYSVANAPENLWHKDFNRAYASGTFGSVDMVIRLNETADFSVKGMLFDASKVAQVASKVVTQSVLLGAQIAGVPVRTASGSPTQSGGDALNSSSASLATNDAAIAVRQAQIDAQRRAIRSLSQTMMSAITSLSGKGLKDKDKEDPTRRPVEQSVETSLTVLRDLLSMQGLQ